MKFRSIFLASAISASLIFSLACKPPEAANNAATPAEREMTEFEREIRSLKTADFDYIYVFRRKDGGAMTAEDKRLIKDKAHFATNRFTLSGDERAVFAGSNFAFEEENLNELKERFNFEDFSKPPEQIKREEEEANANSSSKNSNSNS
ncbi:MAG: hypothetical protein IPM63_14820 [Acidobacteriota bacterium]|nr:MAG: hypothetical protein IPM63_14820 [Acidobacteriota bacterium]